MAEAECGHAGVRRFLVVVEVVAAAAVGDAPGEVDAEPPASEVERVHAVVGHLAAAVVPVPMPVVRDEVVLVRALRCGALPQVVVEMLWHRRWFAPADGAPAARVETARSEHLPYDALVHPLHRLDNERIAAALVAHLHVALVLARGGDHQPRLGGVVAARFLDVNMLAGLAAEDGGWGVPEVWRGDGDGVKMWILEHAP